jgi:hypothetical protein
VIDGSSSEAAADQRLPRLLASAMSPEAQGRPDSFASTLKVQRSAVGSGSGRPELAQRMSQLGRKPTIEHPAATLQRCNTSITHPIRLARATSFTLSGIGSPSTIRARRPLQVSRLTR